MLEMSSTALTGLGEGARYLLEYPYGCAEQKAHGHSHWSWQPISDPRSGCRT
jgi:hypothetical protein